MAAALMVPSACVALAGANDEPYTSFRSSDALVQIGIACSLMTLWLLFAALIIWEVTKRRVKTAWLGGLVLCGLVVAILYQSPKDYLSDLEQFGIAVAE